MKIQSFKKWSENPSYHGSYGDYVRHMEATERYDSEQEQERLAEKIAEKLVKKIKR